MRTRHLVDPELLGLAEAFPNLTFSSDNIDRMRAMAASLATQVDIESLGVEKREILVPEDGDHPAVRCLLYQPIGGPLHDAAYLQIHGGGYVLGQAEDGEARNAKLASELGISVLAVDYRLAPEHPYPAALMDAYRSLVWLAQNGSAFGVSPEKIAVGGDSAGGGLSALLCLYARDQGGPNIFFQNLIYPMLDDRTVAEGAQADPLLGEFVATPEAIRFFWDAIIGDNDASDVAPARAASLKDLPPTRICVGALDVFLDENMAYARRLLQEEVSCDFTLYAGAFHGFDLATQSAVARRFEADLLEGLKRGLSL